VSGRKTGTTFAGHALEHVPSAVGFNGLAFAAGTIVDGLGLRKSHIVPHRRIGPMKLMVLGFLMLIGVVVATALFLGARSAHSETADAEE
jgi:hypothetical protein